MLEKYTIEGNRLSRTMVCRSVKNRELLESDIKRLLHEIDSAVAEGKIESPYIGDDYAEKLGKQDWNEDYLEKLVAVASSSECFNEAFLLHLAEVAEYVKSGGKRTMQKIKAAAIIILVSVLVGFVGGIFAVRKSYANTIAKLKAENSTLTEKIASYADYEQLKTSVAQTQEKLSEYELRYNEEARKTEEFLKLPLGQFLIKQVLAGIDAEMLSESFEKSGYTTAEICDVAASMKLSKKEMERVRDCLKLNDKKIDWKKFKE